MFWGLLVRHFEECPSTGIHMICSSWLDRGYGFAGRRSKRWGATFITLSKEYMLSTWLISVDVYLNQLNETCFFRCLHCNPCGFHVPFTLTKLGVCRSFLGLPVLFLASLNPEAAHFPHISKISYLSFCLCAGQIFFWCHTWRNSNFKSGGCFYVLLLKIYI